MDPVRRGWTQHLAEGRRERAIDVTEGRLREVLGEHAADHLAVLAREAQTHPFASADASEQLPDVEGAVIPTPPEHPAELTRQGAREQEPLFLGESLPEGCKHGPDRKRCLTRRG